jgi:hypothetical protein
MYADDSTLYTSATTASEITATLNKELQLVSECVAKNKLVLNISKTKSIIFGTNHSLNPKPQLNLEINNVEIEQVEVTKRVDRTVVKMGRCLSNEALLCLLNNTINKAGPTVSSFFIPGLLFSRVVRCHKEGPWAITTGSEQGITASPKCTHRV